jgi:hypothetical protein
MQIKIRCNSESANIFKKGDLKKYELLLSFALIYTFAKYLCKNKFKDVKGDLGLLI